MPAARPGPSPAVFAVTPPKNRRTINAVPEMRIYEQSAVIPFRKNGPALEILLITSHRRKRWVIPKGLIEPGLSPAESAVKEALEEAGITGIPGGHIGTYEYEKWGGICRVQVFPLLVREVRKEWEEKYLRERRWFPPAAAAAAVRKPELQKLMANLPDFPEIERLLSSP